MWKWGVAALAAVGVLSPCFVQADEFDHGMNTMWEVLWHQSGTPTRLVRWEQDIRVHISGVNLPQHKQHTLQALRDVATEAGVKVIDISDQPDGAQWANVTVEITPDNALTDREPCVTRLNYRTETTLDSVAMQMRGRDVFRCAHHEAMHVMGVRGHPEGQTVLSYFPSKVDGLLPLDKAMLRAWYSPRMSGGMTPFEVLPVLADQLVAILPDQAAAARSRDRFFSSTIQQMQAFAEGSGDVPLIVKRSGKSTPEGIRFGRMQMSYFLGVAYEKGATVPQDNAQATRWLQHAATLGSRTAQLRLNTTTVSANR
jgi:hypothetical protein